ncbi:hypothetical protein PVAG01_08582 [Phlyctema vagabunda]|uniref:Oxidoreductase n=1 Tax=Phlyctema vagabunda TaxID=108571 RepID=A0ABR4P9W2_9HELO
MVSLSSSSSRKLEISIIGGGLIGPRHAKSVNLNPHATLHSLVDPASHGVSTAASLGTTYFCSIDDLLASTPLPDAAIVCTPNSTHVTLSLQLIAAGVHVLVEKPIATSLDSGRKLIKAALEANIKLLVGHHRRFNPYLVAAKKSLEAKSLGDVIAVQGIWANRKASDYFDGIGEWRRNAESGGVVLINLVHEIDLLQYMLGPIEYISAMPAKKTRGFAAEEGAAINLRFASGAIGSFILSDTVPSPWNFEAGTGENPMIPKVLAASNAGGFYRIMGTQGSLSVPDLTLWHYDNARSGGSWTDTLIVEELEVQQDQVPFDLQVQHLVDVVQNGAQPSCSGEDALRAMVVCDAVKVAMATGQAVEIS